MNWNILKVLVGVAEESAERATPLSGIETTFVLMNSDTTIQFETTVVSDSNDYATLVNTASVLYTKNVFNDGEDDTDLSTASSKQAILVNSSDPDFNTVTQWYARYSGNRGTNNSNVYQLEEGSETEQDGEVIDRGAQSTSTTASTYILKLKTGSTYVKGYYCCFFANSNGSLKKKVTGHTTNTGITIDISSVSDATKVKVNAYFSSNSTTYYAIQQTAWTDFTATTHTDNLSMIYVKGFSAYTYNVYILDRAYYYCGQNYGPVGGSSFRYYDANNNVIDTIYPHVTVPFNGGASGWVSSPITFSAKTPVFKVRVTPGSSSYSTAETRVNMMNYLVNSTGGTGVTQPGDKHEITNITNLIDSNSISIELPKVVDTATIYQETDYPIYNLPNTDFTFKYYDSNGVVEYTTSVTSNGNKITFTKSQLENNYHSLLKTLARYGDDVNQPCEFVVSKPHYRTKTFYAVTSAKPYTDNNSLNYEIYFCDYSINGSIITSQTGTITSEVITRGSESVETGDTIVPFFKRKLYVTINREPYYAFKSEVFNDFVDGFGVGYTGTGNLNVVTSVSETTAISDFELMPYNKCCPANLTFFNECKTAIGASTNMSSVQNFKNNFVNTYLKKTLPGQQTPAYFTEYTKDDATDSLYTLNNHLYTFNRYNYTFNPKTLPNYFTIIPDDEDAAIRVRLQKNGNPSSISLEYRVGQNVESSEWQDYTLNTNISVGSDQQIQFRNKLTGLTRFSTDTNNYFEFFVSKNDLNDALFKVVGPLASLVDKNSQCTIIDGDYSFYRLFYQTSVTDINGLILNPISISEGCYYEMFRECISLVNGKVDIRAENGDTGCFGHMFSGCTNMTDGPSEIKLVSYPYLCCNQMFAGTKITKGPILNKEITGKTFFGQECFSYMFYDCNSLKTLGESTSNATYIGGWYNDTYTINGHTYISNNSSEVGLYSFASMFENCSSLENAPRLNPYIINEGGCKKMYKGCSKLTSAYFISRLTSDTISNYGCESMFEDCTGFYDFNNFSLSAANLSQKCYHKMFYNCSSISGNLPVIKATVIPASGCAFMYGKTFSKKPGIKTQYLNQFITTALTTVGGCGMYGMFTEAQYLDFEPCKREFLYESANFSDTVKMVATANNINNIYNKFTNTSETQGVVYINTTANENRLYVNRRCTGDNIFTNSACVGTISYYGQGNPDDKMNITADGYAYKYTYNYLYLNATALSESCFAYMFNECNRLHYAHHFVLLGKSLSPRCYDHMFYHCDELFSIPLSLSAVTSFSFSACQYMFAHCGTVQPNNNLKNFIGLYPAIENGFNWIEKGNPVLSYITRYYVYKKGLRSIQKEYNYEFDYKGNWEPINVSDDNFAYLGDDGTLYDSISSTSYNLCLVNNAQSNPWLLPTTTAYSNAKFSFYKMFYGCEGLTTAYMRLRNSYTKESMCEYMFGECYSLVTPPEIGTYTTGSSYVETKGYYSTFKNCHEMTGTGCYNNALKSYIIDNAAYAYMYKGCYKITRGPGICATTIGESSCAHMFENCFRMTGLSLNILPSTKLQNNCYASMFQRCMLLENAPGLPSQDLASGCYNYMFNGCCLWYFSGFNSYDIEAYIEKGDNHIYIETSSNGYLNLNKSAHSFTFLEGDKNTDAVINHRYFGNQFYSLMFIDTGYKSYAHWDGSGHHDNDFTNECYPPSKGKKVYSPYSSVYYNGTNNQNLYFYPNDSELYETVTIVSPSNLSATNVNYMNQFFSVGKKYIIAKHYGGSNLDRKFQFYYAPTTIRVYNDSSYINDDVVLKVTGKTWQGYDYYDEILDLSDKLGNSNYTKTLSYVCYYNLTYYENGSIVNFVSQQSNTSHTQGYIATTHAPVPQTGNYVLIQSIEYNVTIPKVLYTTSLNSILNGLVMADDEKERILGYFKGPNIQRRYKIKTCDCVCGVGYTLKFNNSNANSNFHSPTAIRSFEGLSDFYIPLNDRVTWNTALGSITVSANSLTTETALGFMNMLSLTGGTFKAPGSESNYRSIIPNTWSFSH